MENVKIPEYWVYPATVLGCLENGYLTIILCPEIRMANGGVPVILPMQMIPIDLRMPNSKFDIMREVASGNFVKVLRRGGICNGSN
jgi:hypothetical protein